jgi:hypothetical protein
VTTRTTAERLEALRQTLGLLGQPHPETVSVADLRRRLVGISVSQRKAMADTCVQLIEGSRVSRDEATRVFLAKLLVSLLPHALPQFAQLLQVKPRAPLAEVQFSIFCFLDGGAARPKGNRVVLRLIEHYLMSVSRDVAQAAWMAGDLLGDHWDLKESLPVLTAVVLKAHHPAGRMAAIHGLSHALDRGTKRDQWAIVDVLKRVASKDRSYKVRSYAESTLGPLRGT